MGSKKSVLVSQKGTSLPDLLCDGALEAKDSALAAGSGVEPLCLLLICLRFSQLQFLPTGLTKLPSDLFTPYWLAVSDPVIFYFRLRATKVRS
jgi:hypothetical protein